ncbi:glycosyl transferase group 1 [hydrothermal vent metagenome]|uniref:Glycosyl transferase group 1 n=1 Tax=hydrothermal vent metagenome TaxID=652676 RepID=A0A1W1BSZ0_9ZZZZ
MKKLKILIDYSPACREDKTGIPLFVKHIYNELKKIDDIEIDKTFCVSSLIPIKPWFIYRFFEKILYQKIYIPFKLKFGNYDIYIENQYMFMPLFKPKNIKVVNIIYDIALILFDNIQTKKHTDNWRKKLPISIKNSDILITISKSSQIDIQNYLDDLNIDKPLNYIYANVDKIDKCKDKEILKKFNINSEYFLFLGTLEPRKNPLNLVKAFKKFKEESNNSIKMVFAGKKGWLYNEVLEYIKSNSLQNEIIFTGYISDQEKSCLLSNTKAFLFLSIYEGFGMPPLEALEMNTPIILSDIPVFKELFEDSVYYADPYNIENISMSMSKILIDKPDINTNILKKFSWELSAKKLVEIICKN